jgi:glyoxylase-like metal-dependent hydrolase (beta-lactamase superfamily II)
LWSIPVPIPESSLRYVFVHVFETDRGPYLIDAGWDAEDSFRALRDGLIRIGSSISDVRGVLVTHIHPDHYGLAGRIREHSGAWIALHPADAQLISSRYQRPQELLVQVERVLKVAGAPADELEALRDASLPAQSFVDPVAPDVLLEDQQKPDIPGWDLTAIWTPGHSPGHLCFWEGRNRVLLSGDHVLPRITPNVGYHPQSGEDPLSDFLRSLHKVRGLGEDEVLPAHEYRFVGLDERIDQLIAHHESRFREVIDALDAGHDTAWEVAGRMKWSRPWSSIVGYMRRAAVAEAFAHLRTLQTRGQVVEEVGEPSRWRRAEASRHP